MNLGSEIAYFNGTIQPSSGSLDRMSRIVNVPARTNQSRNVYYRVYPLDFNGNKGQSSNIVTLYIPSVIVKDQDPNNEVLPPALFWFLIGLGCVCLILIIAIISYFVYRKRQEKKRGDMGADWVQIGETRLDSIMSSEKKNESPEPEIPDFNMSTISRRPSSGLFSLSKWPNGGYSDGSEM